MFDFRALIQACYCELEEMEPWEYEVGWRPGKHPFRMGPESEGPEWGATAPKWYRLKDVGKLDDEVQPPGVLCTFRECPGTVIDDLEFSDIDKALDDVLKYGDLMHDRRCALSLSNVAGSRLINPQWYFSSGGTHSALYPEIVTGYTGLNLFLKTPWALRGTVGVLTYDIEGTDFKVAVMWEVPYDRNLYDNMFNVKVYPKSFATNDDMYDQMYKYAGAWLAQGWHERNEYGVQMRAVMTDNTHGKVSVWVDTTEFNADGETEVWADCDYHAGWVGKYCWKECNPKGWCWVDRKCSSTSDCANVPLECYSSCKNT